MSSNLNRVTVSGRLTKDVVLKQTRNENVVASFDLASHFYNGKSQPNDVSFIPVRAFGKTAEFIGRYFRKGDEMYVDGSIKEDRWQKDGQSRSFLFVLADSVYFGARKKGDDQQEDPDEAESPGPGGSGDYAPISEEGDLPF